MPEGTCTVASVVCATMVVGFYGNKFCAPPCMATVGIWSAALTPGQNSINEKESSMLQTWDQTVPLNASVVIRANFSYAGFSI